jgi:hypothetical protein
MRLEGYFTCLAEGQLGGIAAIAWDIWGPYGSQEHCKTAIHFHCGGLDLYPDTHSLHG